MEFPPASLLIDFALLVTNRIFLISPLIVSESDIFFEEPQPISPHSKRRPVWHCKAEKMNHCGVKPDKTALLSLYLEILSDGKLQITLMIPRPRCLLQQEGPFQFPEFIWEVVQI